MIEWIIRRSVANRFGADGRVVSQASGGWTIDVRPVDALPDLSDVRVIIKTTANPVRHHKSLKIQVTYPLTTTMLSVPGAKTVRGFSRLATLMCMSFFERWRKSVLGAFARCWSTSTGAECCKLPAGVSAELGPDACRWLDL